MVDAQTSPRRAGIVLGLVILLALAGCAGLSDEPGESPMTNGTQRRTLPA